LSIFLSLRRGHSNFGERGHFYFGLTNCLMTIDKTVKMYIITIR